MEELKREKLIKALEENFTVDQRWYSEITVIKNKKRIKVSLGYDSKGNVTISYPSHINYFVNSQFSECDKSWDEFTSGCVDLINSEFKYRYEKTRERKKNIKIKEILNMSLVGEAEERDLYVRVLADQTFTIANIELKPIHGDNDVVEVYFKERLTRKQYILFLDYLKTSKEK